MSDPGSVVHHADALDAAAYGVQLALGFVFALSAGSKLHDPKGFRRTIDDYALTGPRATGFLVAAVIAVELALAFCYIAGIASVSALSVGIVTVLAFAAATGINLRRGRRIACGCFGDKQEEISARTLARLGIMGAGMVSLAVLISTNLVSHPSLIDVLSTGWAGLEYLVNGAILAALSVVVSAWLLASSDLRHLWRSRTASAAPQSASLTPRTPV